MSHQQFINLLLKRTGTINAACKQAGISPQTVYLWHSRKSWPRLDVFLKFAKATGLLPAFIRYIEDNENPLFKEMR